ncbi:PilW family protein [Nitrospira sp. M1]
MVEKVKKDQGFTLIEVVITLALSVVTVGTIYTVYSSQVRAQVARDDTLDMQQHARAAMDVVVRELKMAGYDPRHVNQDTNPVNDFDGIVYHPTQLHIKADLNGNGSPTDSHEFIRYSHDQETLTLRRDTGGGRQPLAEHIESFSIQYFNRNGVPTIDARQIRQVAVTVKARTARPDQRYSLNQGYRTFTLHSRITLRNIGLS